MMKRLSLDYSKPSSWNLDTLKLEDVNIKSCWDKGRLFTENFIQELNCPKLQAVDFYKLFSENITMLKPNGRKIGVTELNTDHMEWYLSGVVIGHEDTSALGDVDVMPQNVEAENISDHDTDMVTVDSTMIDLLEEVGEDGRKHDSQVEVNQVWFHKSTILKQTFHGSRVSKD